LSEKEEKDIDLQIDVLKAQLYWDWRLTWIVILVGILVAVAVAEDVPAEIRFVILPFLTGIILIFWGSWSDWPDRKAEELREKYARKDEMI